MPMLRGWCEHAHPRVLLGETIGQLRGAVPAAVIHDEDLVLRQHAVGGPHDVGHRPLEIVHLVEGG